MGRLGFRGDEEAFVDLSDLFFLLKDVVNPTDIKLFCSEKLKSSVGVSLVGCCLLLTLTEGRRELHSHAKYILSACRTRVSG